MAPNLLLLGLCFFLKGKEYAYSAIWPVMPLLLGLMLLYRRPKADRWLLCSGVILAVLALPLVGFLAVNYGLVDEFSIGPFSVPRLVQMRSGEISLSHVPDNLKTMLRILLTQSDGLKWNSAGRFGLFYPAALPFGLLGLGALVYRSFTALRDRRYDPAVLLLVWLFTGVGLTALISVNINRMNFLVMPAALSVAFGAETALRLLGRYARVGAALLLAGLLTFFGFFARYYFTDYAPSLSPARCITRSCCSSRRQARRHSTTRWNTNTTPPSISAPAASGVSCMSTTPRRPLTWTARMYSGTAPPRRNS